MSEVFNKIQSIVSAQLGIEADKVTPETNFTADLGADSLDVVELVMDFEEAFDIEIDDDSATNIKTVEDAIDFIENATK